MSEYSEFKTVPRGEQHTSNINIKGYSSVQPNILFKQHNDGKMNRITVTEIKELDVQSEI
jgi:hypothetical protein